MTYKKNILIIGAKSDIGLAVAEKFASEGFSLQLAGRNLSDIKDAIEIIKKNNEVNIELYELDILKYEHLESFIESLTIFPDIILCSVGSLGKQLLDQKNLDSSLSIIII